MTEHLLSYEENYEDISDILQSGKKGQLFYQGVSFTMTEIISPDYKKLQEEKKKKVQVGYKIAEYQKIDSKWINV